MTLQGTVWRPLGPSPIAAVGRQDNGLTTAIAIHPTNSNIILQGTAGGGIWRTTDGGSTWEPLFDRQTFLGVGEPGALTFDPTNASIIYVGASGRVTRSVMLTGLFKSTDGGASFVQLGSGYPAGNVGNANQFVTHNINVIIVDPINPQRLYLSSDQGVFRSLDGGQNWTFGANSGGDARSLVLDPSSPAAARILYAGISGRGVFQSTNGGQNWTQILSGTTPAVSTAVGAAPAGFNKVVVDLAPPASPPNPAGVQVLYVALEGTGGAPDPVGLFLSTNQGATWGQQTATNMPTGTQRGYSFHFAVDPASPGNGTADILYFGAVGQARSGDSGANFTALTGLHADTHSWAFVRQPAPTASIVYSGNDGGLFRSTDGGANWTALNAGGAQTTLFYNISLRSDATASETVGTLQDNGIQTTSGAAGSSWNSPQGGDGWDVAYDGVTANQVFGTSGFWPAPCTRLFVSTADGTDFSPTVPTPQEITPWGTTSDAGCYLAGVATDPSTADIVYVSGSQNLWQSRDAGVNWNQFGPFPGSGNPEVARSNGNNVLLAVGTQVFVSTNALGPAASVTFTDITSNLPTGTPPGGGIGRNVLRAAFDPSDPTVIYAVLGGFDGGPGFTGHVFRTTIGGTATPVWTDISPVLDVPFGALALDGTDTPTTIYVGTDLGVLRSVDGGASWSVLDDIHFPRAWVTDLVFSPQARVLRAATYGRGVFEFARSQDPAISVNPENGFDFGTVCDGPVYLSLQIFNVGASDLVINSVQRLMGSTGFTVLPFPGTPVVVKPGEEIDFTLSFVPTTPGTPEAATIRITSNDPGAPVLDLFATATGGTSSLEIVVPDHGDFGAVCLGSFVDRHLVVNNRGPCPLHIFGISSTSPAFIPPDVWSFPLVVAAGNSIEVPIRFQPIGLGPESASLTFFSNDPNGPDTVRVFGNAPAPRLSVAIADDGNFGNVCVGSFRDLLLTLSNSGCCPLTITGISSSSSEFLPPGVDAYPLTVAPGTSVPVKIRFQPTSFGPKSATLTIASDDVGGPRTLAVSGNAPSGRLAVSGSTQFGGVEFGQRVQQTLTICNVGDCDLHVTRVAFKPLCGCDGEYDESGCTERHGCGHDQDCDQRCSQFSLINNPFPATLHPGACLPLVIQFKPRCDTARCCELMIQSDDPKLPQKTMFVSGHLRRTLASALKCWGAAELKEMLDAGSS